MDELKETIIKMISLIDNSDVIDYIFVLVEDALNDL